MTPDDAQIDILLRRHARRTEGESPAGHLDADELSAFAEGALPAETRSRYVSHLSDCADCRQLASQLSLASGAVSRAAAASPIETKTISWRGRLSAFFRPPTLRYAGFALVLVMAASVVFVVMRRQGNDRFVVKNESIKEQPGALKQADSPVFDQNSANGPVAAPQAQSSPKVSTVERVDTFTASATPAVPSKAGEGTIASAISPKTPIETKKEVDTAEDAKRASTQGVPSFAPAPPGETGRQKTLAREDETRSAGALGGARKADADKLKTTNEQARNFEYGKDRRGPYDNSNQRNQQAANAQTGNLTTLDDRASRNEPRVAERKAASKEEVKSESKPDSAGRDVADKAPEVRSAGGHKFRRQGSVWVDTKYKSSMTIIMVQRSSDEYRALSSAAKAAVDQLGSGVIVVSKGKAYRIQ